MENITKLTPSEISVINGLAQNGLRLSKTARDLCFARSSIDYIVDRIRFKTGLDPLDFYDMIKLIEMVKGGSSEGKGRCDLLPIKVPL